MGSGRAATGACGGPFASFCLDPLLTLATTVAPESVKAAVVIKTFTCVRCASLSQNRDLETKSSLRAQGQFQSCTAQHTVADWGEVQLRLYRLVVLSTRCACVGLI